FPLYFFKQRKSHVVGLAEWNIPKGGMFVWLKVNKIKDVMELADKECISHGIFVIPGHAFNYDRSKPEQHIRLSYSFSTPEEIDEVLVLSGPSLYLIYLPSF
ncbi:unnamed protein product, partial [Heterotrigona itama]